MNSQIKSLFSRRLEMPFCLLILFSLAYSQAYAQEQPPKPIIVTVSTAQYLSFGSFVQNGSSGTVSVDYTGSRSSTGSIYLPAMFSIVTPALFLVTAEPGTLITIVNGGPFYLTNGGFKLKLTIGAASTGSPFITTNSYSTPTNVFVGGTLTVNDLTANPPGTYNGTFDVTFVQQ